MRLQESLLLIKSKWLSFSSRQKISVTSLVFLMLALPLSVGAVLTQQYLGSRASIPVTPPITPPTSTPISTIKPTSTPSPSTLPDLAIIEPILVQPNPANITDLVLVSFKMVNIGTSVAYPAVYSYTDQMDGYSRIHSSNTCNGSTSLRPGESCVSAYTFTFDKSETKILKISLDRDNILQESNELNNNYSVSVVVGLKTSTPAPVSPTPVIQTASPTPIVTQKPSSTPSISPVPTPTPKPVCRFKIFKKCLLWSK